MGRSISQSQPCRVRPLTHHSGAALGLVRPGRIYEAYDVKRAVQGFWEDVSAHSRRCRRRSILPISAAAVALELVPSSADSLSSRRREIQALRLFHEREPTRRVRSGIYSGSFCNERPTKNPSDGRRHSPYRALLMGTRPASRSGSPAGCHVAAPCSTSSASFTSCSKSRAFQYCRVDRRYAARR